MREIIVEIDKAIKYRKSKLVNGHMPRHWNDDLDYRENNLRSEMNGLELAKWIMTGMVGKLKKWG
jgi:hypothetical protein